MVDRSADGIPRYSDHTYIVLTLQKLVHLHKDSEGEDDEGEDESNTIGSSKRSKSSRLLATMRGLFRSAESTQGANDIKELRSTPGNGCGVHDPTVDIDTAHTDGVHDAPVQKLRTLQRYHGGPNQERMAFMEEESALTTKNLVVCAEQVSIFLTSGERLIIIT
jgi:hypothetical protein